MKGKIKYIQEKGEWSNSSGTFNKFQVTFDDGLSYQFLAKGQFKKQVGDMCEYEIPINNMELQSSSIHNLHLVKM